MSAPMLRFKEFDGDWVVKKIGEISDCIVPGRNKPKAFNGDIPWVTTPDLQNKVYVSDTKSGLYITHEEAQQVGSKIVPINSVIMSCVGDLGLFAINTKPMVINQQLHAFLLNGKKFDSLFILNSLSTKLSYIDKIATKTALPYLNKDNCNSIPVVLPPFQEQTKIASFLSAVDEKISQLNQKHRLLSEYKQGMMQKLFSQQIRFKEDDGSEFGAWESKRLGEVGENIIGLTYSPTDVTNDGSGILVLRSSNIKNGRLDKLDQVRVNKVIKEKIIVQPNDILICTRNGSQRLIGKSVIINDVENMTFGAFMSVYRSKYNCFISYLMQTPWFFEQVQMNLGARINQITTGTLNEFIFDFPSLAEQTKIANFLSAIDQKIEVVAEQIKQAKTWKKGLLQQMFV